MYNLNQQLEAFHEGISKMRANYGKENFTKERADLIWDELKNFSPKQIKNICDVVLGENTRAPTLYHFREKCALLREKIRQWERDQDRQDAKDFWEGTYQPDDVKMVMQTIKDRVMGKCDDNTWAEFQDFLKAHASNTQLVKCKKCEDTGVYYDEKTRAFICPCKQRKAA